jgi:hypothetical protein
MLLQATESKKNFIVNKRRTTTISPLFFSQRKKISNKVVKRKEQVEMLFIAFNKI